jgi:branched-chain amino acid transport system permease protein
VFWSLVIAAPIAAFAAWALWDNTRLFVITFLNGLTLASLYFIVASGFTLVFGLMRNVNLAHGSLYLFGAYVGWVVGDKTGSWVLAVMKDGRFAKSPEVASERSFMPAYGNGRVAA